jgi:hypothetical protein
MTGGSKETRFLGREDSTQERIQRRARHIQSSRGAPAEKTTPYSRARSQRKEIRIEVADLFEVEPAPLQQLSQLVAGVAPSVLVELVMPRPEEHKGRHGNDHCPSGTEDSSDSPKGSDIVVEMLEHVK